MSEARKGHVEVTGLTAGYDGAGVLDVDQLSIHRGEFLSILGPSGCGKTTLLNCIAGFVQPTGGRISVDDKDITNLPPHKRGLGMVFQNYALFPHMSVADNVAYGLKIRRLDKAERTERVTEALRLVGLESFAERRPSQLSGGQQQRVAVARALAIRPAVMLLDEPLSNLDAKLRREMRAELRTLQQQVGTTMIFVTHDQEEALSLSDRVAVLNSGRIEQVGTPHEVYRRPATRFVAQFIGAANVLEGTVDSSGRMLDVDGVAVHIGTSLKAGSTAAIAVRPERVVLGGSGQVSGTVGYRGFTGDAWQVEVRLPNGTTLTAQVPEATGGVEPPLTGSSVSIGWDPADVIVLERG